MWLKMAQHLFREHSHSSLAQQKEATNGLCPSETAIYLEKGSNVLIPHSLEKKF